jgi:NAD(P)-dependent dehydrogenase (short-subunit alcohol dehydrogenase family)
MFYFFKEIIDNKMDTQVILIIGSSRDIGAGVAKGFAQLGYRVIVNYSK